ncbi:MAG TPA: OmpA family protein [Rhodopila sp.]|jgi:outer membrane protein OmpA-like peptidoglycan-associated protein
MKFRNALVVATMLALPIAAQAQPISGLYVGAGAGINIMQDEPIKTLDGSDTGLNLQTNVGATGVGSVGWGFGNGFRAEMEFDYRYNGYDKVTGGGGSGHIGGSEQKYGPMVNVLYDFNGISPTFVPYVGLGAGYQWVNESIRTGVAGHVADTEGSFAYQAILGAALPISSVPGLSLTAEYRFMGLAGDRSYDNLDAKFGDNFNHSVLIGMRYAFGAPAPAPMAPAPMAVPASPVSRSYLVFFDWDKADLTARARQIVAEAAANSTKVQYTRLEVNGYTDTSGTPQYNQGLSIRRAQSVAAELVRDGVPKSAIAIQGFGETHLLVATGPGVREPQNRRVEIIIK